MAKLNLEGAAKISNDETLDTWNDLVKEAGAAEGPISPFVEKELLKDKHLSIDGSLFERETGFNYDIPKLGEKELIEVVESFKRMNWWP